MTKILPTISTLKLTTIVKIVVTPIQLRDIYYAIVKRIEGEIRINNRMFVTMFSR